MKENKENPTQQQMARDLAEKVMGFRWESNHPAIGCWVERFGNWRLKFVPFISRDDCAELLGRLTDEQKQSTVTVLRNSLCEETPVGGWLGYWLLLTATPAQIAEAVWRATCQ